MLTSEISSASADLQQALTEVTGSLKTDAASSVNISDTHTKIQMSLPHPKRSPETVLEKQRQASEKSNTTGPFQMNQIHLFFTGHVKRICHHICRPKPLVAHALLFVQKTEGRSGI